MATLTHVSRAFDEIINRPPHRHAPFVGDSAFTTKAGIHASAILKNPATYEHVAPERVGNRRQVLVSDQAGKSNVLAELERLGVAVNQNDPRILRLLDEMKDREAQGYAYEGADASFFLLAKRVLGEVPDYFFVERFSVNVERRWNAVGHLVTVAEAIVKVRVDGNDIISAAEGNGPVNALDVALRKDLGKYQNLIADVELIDYRVRIFQGGSDAVTRVLITSRDAEGETWTTVGVSPNIIDASFQALMDSIVYQLMRAGRRAGLNAARPNRKASTPAVRPGRRWRRAGRGRSIGRISNSGRRPAAAGPGRCRSERRAQHVSARGICSSSRDHRTAVRPSCAQVIWASSSRPPGSATRRRGAQHRQDVVDDAVGDAFSSGTRKSGEPVTCAGTPRATAHVVEQP